MNAHHSSAMKSDTYITPKWIIDSLGNFDLDPCTPPIMPWPTAGKPYACHRDRMLPFLVQRGEHCYPKYRRR